MQTTSSYMRNKSKLGKHVKKSDEFLVNEDDPELHPEIHITAQPNSRH
jgi:hypothetical protein